MLNQTDPTDRRSFIRYVGRLALVGLGVGVLAQPALAEDDPDATLHMLCGLSGLQLRFVRIREGEVQVRQSWLLAVHGLQGVGIVLHSGQLLLTSKRAVRGPNTR